MNARETRDDLSGVFAVSLGYLQLARGSDAEATAETAAMTAVRASLADVGLVVAPRSGSEWDVRRSEGQVVSPKIARSLGRFCFAINGVELIDLHPQ